MFRWVLLLSLISCSVNAFGQNTPNLPYFDRGACPFECCTYRTWIARNNVSLRKEMRTASPLLFSIKKGERVNAITGVVITSKAGIVEVIQDTKIGGLNIKSGSKLYTLTYLGEGFYKIWYKGKIYEESVEGEKAFKIVSQPKAVWWVKIKNKKGQIGWTNLSDSFDDQDACG
jgi:hypothetical protein